MGKASKYIMWFSEIDKEDIALVGGKGANLGEMYTFNVPVPNGFVVTSKAYFDFLSANDLKGRIQKELKSLSLSDPQSLNMVSQRVERLIIGGKIPPDLAKEIINNYLKLGGLLSFARVAVRSSATAEDLPTASFAGQQKSFLNVSGEANVLTAVKECWASLFEARAIFYRQEKGFDHFKVGIAVPIQEMVPAEISGVMFTVDPISNLKNRIVIEAIYGLGEYIVQGIVTPDTYVVDKNTLEILHREIAKQEIQLTFAKGVNKKTDVPKSIQTRRKLKDSQIIELAKVGKRIHQHYFYPQDIEWTLWKGKFKIVQTRPITTLNVDTTAEEKSMADHLVSRKPILVGQPASPGIASGPVQIIKTAREICKVAKGDILVTEMTTPEFVPAMKKVSAIIADSGGQTSHAAIVSRELGIPCIVGAKTATTFLKNEQIITVNGSNGKVYQGGMLETKFPKPSLTKISAVKRLSSTELVKTATKIYVNLGEPELAKEVSARNVDGIGLLRAEFLVAQIGSHPKKIIKDRKSHMFIDRLSIDIKTFCESFYPKPVIYRALDFKTNEYQNLVGGKAYEPQEENPFIGYRGAFRYLADPSVFELELEAIKKVRTKYKMDNLSLMIPFCRTPRELTEVKRIVVGNGLSRTSSFKLWLMVEIPSNVVLLPEFIKVGIDGVSIGSNDLTMLTLGVDRDNSQLSGVFNELDPAVLWMIETTIKTCLKNKITCSICGQAASNADLLDKLVQWGITSVSVNPDAIERTRDLIYDLEAKRTKKHV